MGTLVCSRCNAKTTAISIEDGRKKLDHGVGLYIGKPCQDGKAELFFTSSTEKHNTTSNETTKKYSNEVPNKITFDNQALFLLKIRQQELITFDKFFDTLDEIGTVSSSKLDDIKKTLLIKSFDINSSSGLATKIKYILEIFGQALNLFYVAVEPNPKKPLEYHISTTIPVSHWTETLRKMLHPVSWVDHYHYIDQTSSFQKDAKSSTYFNYFQTTISDRGSI